MNGNTLMNYLFLLLFLAFHSLAHKSQGLDLLLTKSKAPAESTLKDSQFQTLQKTTKNLSPNNKTDAAQPPSANQEMEAKFDSNRNPQAVGDAHSRNSWEFLLQLLTTKVETLKTSIEGMQKDIKETLGPEKTKTNGGLSDSVIISLFGLFATIFGIIIPIFFIWFNDNRFKEIKTAIKDIVKKADLESHEKNINNQLDSLSTSFKGHEKNINNRFDSHEKNINNQLDSGEKITDIKIESLEKEIESNRKKAA